MAHAAKSAALPHSSTATGARAQLDAHLRSDIMEMRERMDAVVAATHDAAMMIIATVESTFETLGPTLSPELQQNLFSVLSACAFQDIAGQHLARMTELLNDIQHCTVDASIDEARATGKLERKNASARKREEKMTGGPSVQGAGIEQRDIDGLLTDLT